MYQKIATMATGQSDSAFTFKTAGAAPNLRHLSLSLSLSPSVSCEK